MAGEAARGMERRGPFMIGVAGGTASGKSTVCERLMEGLGQNQVSDEEKQVGDPAPAPAPAPDPALSVILTHSRWYISPRTVSTGSSTLKKFPRQTRECSTLITLMLWTTS